MITCMYQPAVPLAKNCLLRVNRETKKVLVSKLSDGYGGKVKIEIAPDRPETSLPETCGLNISELEAMAARQARQLETQDQLLAAKAQRLRFLKSGGEAERLQRLRDKVAAQEERLRKLRALRGKVHSNRGTNSNLSSDLESLRAVFNEKEKELTVAVAKVDDLTRQLDELRRGSIKEPQNGQSVAAVELEKLRRELLYRQKLREAQATRVAAQRAALSQRQDEMMRVDRRIAELQERLHRKRLLNHQLAVTLKHQESADDFVTLPSKNDPKYQTLPYNTKLFAPFGSKNERDNFEKSMQQMQIIQLDPPPGQNHQQYSYQHLETGNSQNHTQERNNWQNNQGEDEKNHHHSLPASHTLHGSNKSNQQLSMGSQYHHYGNNNSSNNIALQHVKSQNQVNAKSGAIPNHSLVQHQQQQHSAPSLLLSHHQGSLTPSPQQDQQSSFPSSIPNSSSSNAGSNSGGNNFTTANSTSNGSGPAHNNNAGTVQSSSRTGKSGNNSSGTTIITTTMAPSSSTNNNNGLIVNTSSNLSGNSINPGQQQYPSPSSNVTSQSGKENNSSSHHTLQQQHQQQQQEQEQQNRPNNYGPTSTANSTIIIPSSTSYSNSLSVVSTTATSSLTPAGNQIPGHASSTKDGSVGSSASNGMDSNSSSSLLDPHQSYQHQDLSIHTSNSRHSKPALPPKPAKPTPPPRGQGGIQDGFNQRSSLTEGESSSSSSSGRGGGSERSELAIKAKPLFIKKSGSAGLSNNFGPSFGMVQSGGGIQSSGSNNNSSDKDGGKNGTTVRVSINRRIEMPPAFLFPESDPPPSDLIPDHQSSGSVGHSGDGKEEFRTQQLSGPVGGKYHSSSGSANNKDREALSSPSSPAVRTPLGGDTVDSTALEKSSLTSTPSSGEVAEEYTLPDLFPHHPAHHHNYASLQSSSPGTGSSGVKNTSAPSSDRHHHLGGNNNINNNLGSGVNNGNNSKQVANFHQNTTTTTFTNASMIQAVNNNNTEKDKYIDAFFSPASATRQILNSNAANAMNNANLMRSGGNSSNGFNPMMMGGEGDPQRHYGSRETGSGADENMLGEHENNHVSVMSIHVSECSPLGESKMDLSPIQLESYEVEEDHHRSVDTMIDPNLDRDENASDTNSGSTITTTTSSVSSGSGAVLRRVKKGNLKSSNRDHIPLGRRVSFDPLALLLDASLEGELDLVVKTAGEVGNPSAANDEGITALHNAICAGHIEVVRFLVEFGCDVNAQDSDGWTPLHCAASCNNVIMVKFLVERGACIFATTLSDHETAAEKCEEDEDGYGPCSEYLYSIQEKLGIMNGGVTYGVFDYDAQNPDELSFGDGDRLVILRKGDEYEREWWWAASGENQGYVPRNLLGLYPRVVPHKQNES